MRRLGFAFFLVAWPAVSLAAGLPFTPPADFTRTVDGGFEYTVSPYVLNTATHEYIVAEAFPTVTTQAQLVRTLNALKQQLPRLPHGGSFDQQVTICGAIGVHGTYVQEDRHLRWAVDEWTFISNGAAYVIDYMRPTTVPRNDAVVKKLQKFCPGDESQMEVLGLTGFDIGGPSRRYKVEGVWEQRTLGGLEHNLVYLSGTNLDYDPSMRASYMVYHGFKKKLSATIAHCGTSLQKDILTYGDAKDGITLEREFATVLDHTSALIYTRDSLLPASPAVENAFKSFCIPQPPRVDFSGTWGGAGAALAIQARAATFSANCMRGAMVSEGPSLNSLDGHTFDRPGTLISGSTEREVRYLGSAANRRMRLQIVSLTGKLLARFDLKFGSHGDLHGCGARS
ncbi:MAG TPA: hypothetical protein VFO29_01215 [Candidatus Rubrimentiphilum sp.]|nr:hypothetical protein [Candidatus Rubrimentiphilum sp.]